MSRKSKASENFEEMELEELEGLIRQAEDQMNDCNKQKLKMSKSNKSDFGTQKAKEQKLAPLEEEIKFWRHRIIMLYQIKNYKIPFYEKLPKDSQFYRHLITLLSYNKMKEST